MKKLLKISFVLAITVGVVLVFGALWGITFTYNNVAREKIITPADASIPDTPVRGPLTLKSQSDIIRTHTLKITGGQTYSQMPRQIPKLDIKGSPILDEKGKPVMVSNDGRDIWIEATALTTAINLGMITYAFFGLVLLFGLISIWTGIVFRSLGKRY